MKTELDIVLPIFNPSGKWHEIVLERYLELRSSLPDLQGKLILVDDGSYPVHMESGLEYLTTRIPELLSIGYKENMGKGYALRSGLKVSDAAYCLMTDVDFPFTTQSMIDVVSHLKHNHVVVGIRDDNYFKNLPIRRRILSKAVGLLVKIMFGLPIRDTQCGLKAVGKLGKEVFLDGKINSFIYDVEFLQAANKSKEVDIQQVEVTLNDGIIFSSMAISALARELKNILKLFLRK